jgi:hypothetical protein
VTAALAFEISGGNSSKLAMKERYQLVECRLVAVAPGEQ